MSLNEALSKRIKELLFQNDFTQYKLFKLSGIYQSEISKIINQKTKKVAVTTLYALAQGFGMNLSEFFDSPLFKNNNIID